MSDGNLKTDRTWLIVAGAFVGFWLLYLIFFVPGRRQPLEDAAMDEPAEYDWSLTDLNEQPVPFSRFKRKTVFLNIWATWCRPCVGEMPSIASLSQNPRLKDKDIEFVCVSTDDSAARVNQFLRDKNWPMTVLRAQALPAVFQSDAIPATYLITPGGRVVASLVGANDWNTEEAVALLEKVAKRKSAGAAAAASGGTKS
jgi:thiol-disulfide isomerase/thioredoxin